MGPFTQQASGSVSCRRALSGVNFWVFLAGYYGEVNILNKPLRPGIDDLDMSTKARITNAIIGTERNCSELFYCRTGNCTFEELNGNSLTTSSYYS